MRITVLDYGVGNIFSVFCALKAIGCDYVVDTDGSQVAKANAVLVPGVASFGTGLQNLRKSGQADSLRHHFKTGKPLIGLCLGAQMFLDRSEEDSLELGLGFVKGQVVRLDSTHCRVPNQGWFDVNSVNRTHGALSPVSGYYYFSHSYQMIMRDHDSVVATAFSGHQKVLAIYRENNVIGVQFHPELSGNVGLAFISDLLKSIGLGND